MAELRAWQPGYLDRLKYGIAGLMGDDRQSVRDAEKITSLLEYVPGVGDAMAGAEAVDEFSASNYGAAGLLGAAAVAGLVPGVGDAAAQGIKKGIRAYHGSPHNFDKFDMSKIGTGEGAQAYGHGLYFAEREDVAKSYREAGRRSSYGSDYATATLKAKDGDYEKAANLIREEIRQTGDFVSREELKDLNDALYLLERKKTSTGNMYEVNINANPDDFLDWDKPLSEQSQKVQEAINAIGSRGLYEASEIEPPFRPALAGNPRGRQVVAGIRDTVGGTAYSETLRDAGIPGIKFLDAGSRGAGDGSRNYVVFDDALIEILRKYGIAGLGLLGAGGAAYNAEQDGPAPLL